MAKHQTPISRRGLLAGLALAPALAATRPAMAAMPAAPPPPGPHPSLIAQARAALDTHRITARDVVGIADYSQQSAMPRFFLFEPDSGRVTALRVAHGRGSDPGHTGWLQRFSGAPGSAASSAGAYRTADIYMGKHGRSRRLIGLDPQNETALERAIVIHGAWYCEAPVLAETGKLGRSEGCFAFSASDAALVLDRLGPGRLIFSGRA